MSVLNHFCDLEAAATKPLVKGVPPRTSHARTQRSSSKLHISESIDVAALVETHLRSKPDETVHLFTAVAVNMDKIMSGEPAPARPQNIRPGTASLPGES